MRNGEAMKIQTVESGGTDTLLILKVGRHELHIAYVSAFKLDHELLMVSEHLKNGRSIILSTVDFTALKGGEA